MAATIALLLTAGAVVLDAFEKPPAYIADRVISSYLLLVEEDDNGVAFLPTYYYEDMDILPYAFDKHVDTLDDFEKWKGSLVAKQYGDRPTMHEMSHEYDLVSVQDRDGYTLNEFTMNTIYPDDIMFYRLVPDVIREGSSAVLVIPGSGHQGVRDVLGEPSDIEVYYYQDEIAKRLALEGYEVFTLELHGYGQRAINVGDGCATKSAYEQNTICSTQLLANRLAMYGMSLNAIQTDEITQLVAHMVYDAGKENIAIVGLSLGAGFAATQAIINPDAVDAVVMASGSGVLSKQPISHSSTGSGQFLCCDPADSIATIAPMPIYVSFGTKETLAYAYEAESGNIAEFLGRVYELHGAEDNFYYHVHDGIHRYHMESILDFLGTHVG